jgi:O-acetyl-ADP-ribose deacetylase (regulator of RNase III)
MELAAKVAVEAVRDFLSKEKSVTEVVFVCFSSSDLDTYNELLAKGS